MRAWVLLAALLLAGCSDAPTVEDDGIAVGDSATTDITGAIAGVVVDPAIRPVPGATVVLQNGDEATTDEIGVFVFEQLEPGFYSLSISAPGHTPVQTTTDVQAGEVSKVRVVVPIDTSPQPYHTTLEFNWFDSAGITLVDFIIDLVDETFLGNTLPNQCDACQFFFETQGPVETFVVEAHWEDNIANPAGPTSYYWTLADGEDWTNGYQDGYFRSGEPARVENNHFGDLRSMQIKMTADETWVTVDQSAELFVTMFYVARAPEGWSFIAGDP